MFSRRNNTFVVDAFANLFAFAFYVFSQMQIAQALDKLEKKLVLSNNT